MAAAPDFRETKTHVVPVTPACPPARMDVITTPKQTHYMRFDDDAV